MKHTAVSLLVCIAAYVACNCRGDDAAVKYLQDRLVSVCTDGCGVIESMKRAMIDARSQKQIAALPRLHDGGL